MTQLKKLMRNSNGAFDALTSMISNQMYVSQSTEIKTGSIQANYLKGNISSLNNLLNIQDSSIEISSFCDLLISSCDKIITQRVIRKIKTQAFIS